MMNHKHTILLLGLLSVSMVSSQHQASSAGAIEMTGDVLQVLIPALSFGTVMLDENQDKRTEFYQSFFSSLALTHGLKHAVENKRPNGSAHSFPSGHTSSAFQGAAFIHARYGFRYAVSAYIGAAFTGYSRIQSDHHYIEDVLAGAAIGILSNFIFSNQTDFKIVPFVDDNAAGISIHTRW